MPTSPGEPPAPVCPYCGAAALLVTGEVLYPHRHDLAHRFFWQCTPCDAYVGTHDGTRNPLGTLANKELRRARMILHDRMIDPLWKGAPDCGAYDHEKSDKRAIKKIQRAARPRVYRFLAHELGISVEETHAGMFTIEQCRAAWQVLKGVTYLEIREWDRQHRS